MYIMRIHIFLCFVCYLQRNIVRCKSTLYYYFENTEGIIRSEISNAKIRDAKIIMDHIRQAIQSRKAELGNVIEQCYCEIQTFLLWHQYIEPYSRNRNLYEIGNWIFAKKSF